MQPVHQRSQLKGAADKAAADLARVTLELAKEKKKKNFSKSVTPVTSPKLALECSQYAKEVSDGYSKDRQVRAGGLFSPYAFQLVLRFANPRNIEHYKWF
jgi:hypothetical protein